MSVRLDALDWRILKELQADGRMTNVALAERVGLSAPPCLRRVRALEEAGLIAGYTVLLDEPALGFSLTAFAMVGLHNQAEASFALSKIWCSAGRWCGRPTCCRARATTC